MPTGHSIIKFMRVFPVSEVGIAQRWPRQHGAGNSALPAENLRENFFPPPGHMRAYENLADQIITFLRIPQTQVHEKNTTVRLEGGPRANATIYMTCDF